jgi:hypothetical protein
LVVFGVAGLTHQLRFVESNPDFRRTAQVVVQAAKALELDGESRILHREPLNLPSAGTVFFQGSLHRSTSARGRCDVSHKRCSNRGV